MFIIWLCWLFRFWKGDRELEVRTATYGPGIDQSQHAKSVSHIINIYVYVYVYVYICMFKFLSVCLSVCVSLSVCLYVCVYVCLSVCVYMCTSYSVSFPFSLLLITRSSVLTCRQQRNVCKTTIRNTRLLWYFRTRWKKLPRTRYYLREGERTFLKYVARWKGRVWM